MKEWFVLGMVILGMIGLASAEFLYDNPSLPKLNVGSNLTFIGGNLTEFIDLTDTPSTYSGSADDCVLVNSGETALVFGSCATGSGDITSVQGDNIYIYNGSDSGAVVLVFNQTHSNLTNDARYHSINSQLGNTSTQIFMAVDNGTFLKIADWNTTNISYRTLDNFTFLGNGSFSIDVCIEDGNCLSTITGDNSSWNQSYANTLYHSITSQLGNTTSQIFAVVDNGTFLKIDDFNVTNESYRTLNNITFVGNVSATLDFCIENGNCLSAVTGDNASWNQSYANNLYILQANEGSLNVNSSDFWDNYDSTNSTQFENTNGVLTIVTSWFTTFFNGLFAGKTTDNLAQGSINLYDNKSWNETYADTQYPSYAFLNNKRNLTNGTFIDDIELNQNNITNVSHQTFCNEANCWQVYVNDSDWFIIEGV